MKAVFVGHVRGGVVLIRASFNCACRLARAVRRECDGRKIFPCAP